MKSVENPYENNTAYQKHRGFFKILPAFVSLATLTIADIYDNWGSCLCKDSSGFNTKKIFDNTFLKREGNRIKPLCLSILHFL